MSHILTTASKDETPYSMIFFDSESRVQIEITQDDIQRTLDGEHIEKEHSLYLICACFTKRNKSGEYSEDWRDYYPDDNPEFKELFWNEVDQFIGEKKRCFMFAHNAGYDVIATGCIPALLSRGYRVQAFSDSNPFFLKLAKFKNDDPEQGVLKSLCIVSSTNYYQFSLAKLGECFNIPKTEIDYEVADIKEAIPYCRNDVLILKVAMMGFISFIKEENLGSFAMTIAGQAMNAFRRRFLQPDKIYIHKDEKSLILERQAYAGGRNEAWRIGDINEPVYYVDVNSMYPAVMLENKFPVKLVTHRKRGKVKELQDFIKKGYLIVAEVLIRTTKPIYFKKDGKLVFPVGEFKTTLSTPELIRALQDGAILKVFQFNLYEADYIFKDYVEYFYNKRLEAKAAGDEVRTLMYKLFLNSLYGKFGQKALNWEKIDEAPPDMIKTETIVHVRTGAKITYKVFGGSRFVRETKPDGQNDAYNAFPAIAAHVTAYARMKLWNNIEIAGLEKVFYMDTDSLLVNEVGYNNLVAAGVIDQKILGAMKLEDDKKMLPNPSSSVRINGCKDYKWNNIKKIKGVSNSSKQLEEGKYISTVWRGLSKFIKEGELGSYKNEMIIKTLARRYDKGLIAMDGNVIPFTFEGDMNLFKQAVEEQAQELKARLSEMKEYARVQRKVKPPEIDLIINMKGLRPELNGAYREELSQFPYPYRNFKKGEVIDRAVFIINGTLHTEHTANDILEILYNHIHRQHFRNEIQALEEQLAAVGVQDYYKQATELPFPI